MEGDERGRVAAKSLMGLNEQFAKWIQERVAENPSQSLADGARHYLSFLSKARQQLEEASGTTSKATSREQGGDRGSQGEQDGGGGDAQRHDKEEEEEGEEASGKTIDERRAKLYFLRGKRDWDDNGVGNLTVRELEAGGSAVEFRNNAGKPILSARVYEGMKMQLRGKNILAKLFNASSSSGEPTEQMCMIRVKDEEQAHHLHSLLSRLASGSS